MFDFVAGNPARHLVVAAVLFFCICFGVCFGEQLRAGASYAVISPEEPMILMGYPRHFGNYNRRECGRDFEIRVSDDEDFAGYTVAAKEQDNSTSIMSYRFDAVRGRYVRFHCMASYGGRESFELPAVYEMEVWGPQEQR